MRHANLAETICSEARRWGVRLDRRENNIIVTPGGKAPAEFLELIRENKPAVLAWLEAMEAGLPKDQAPWLHIGKQILAGEFDGSDSSTRESLTIGLRSIAHPTCKAALARLIAAAKEQTP